MNTPPAPAVQPAEDEGRGDGGRGDGGRENETQQKEKVKAKPRGGAVLRSLDFPFFPCLKVVKRSEGAATPLVAPRILSTGGQRK